MKAYQTRGECKKAGVNVAPALVANSQSALLVQPTDSLLDNPAKDSYTASMLGASFREEWFDSQPSGSIASHRKMLRAGSES